MTYALHHGDCLEVMATLPDASIDCVLTDPPYGTTACKWDSVIPFEPMWKELKRIAKPKAAICLFGSQPFTSALVMSNPKMFKEELVWEKSKATGHALSFVRHLKAHETIVVFGKGDSTYNPQKQVGKPYKSPYSRDGNNYAVKQNPAFNTGVIRYDNLDGRRFPRSVFCVSDAYYSDGHAHPTQKPVELLRYLIRTYTNEGETVLDFTMGSGSTGVACQLESRLFIGIEKDEAYFEMAKKRIAETEVQEPLFGPVSVILEQGSLI